MFLFLQLTFVLCFLFILNRKTLTLLQHKNEERDKLKVSSVDGVIVMELNEQLEILINPPPTLLILKMQINYI